MENARSSVHAKQSIKQEKTWKKYRKSKYILWQKQFQVVNICCIDNYNLELGVTGTVEIIS